MTLLLPLNVNDFDDISPNISQQFGIINYNPGGYYVVPQNDPVEILNLRIIINWMKFAFKYF